MQVVERVETFDWVVRTRLSASYRYHHGFYDPVEREFRAWVRYEERRSVLHDQAALEPENAGRWFALARLNARMGLWETARRQALSGLRRAPADGEGNRLLAEINRHVAP